MSKPKPTKTDMKKRKERAAEWRAFMRDLPITEKKLAECLGISRRTVQYIKACKVTPHSNTVMVFKAFKAKHQGKAA
jgi:citrate lyase synthetase